MAEFTNGWKPYEYTGNCEIAPDFVATSKQKLHVQIIEGREIVFAGDEYAVKILEQHGFSQVKNLVFKKGKDWE